ncbi:MAG: phosphoribosyltransferase family protein [Bacteroidota bacterium]
MDYRSLDDLSRTILKNRHKVPPDVDLIVGIPRSGILASNLTGLALNVPVTDLDGFLRNTELVLAYRTKTRPALTYPREAKHVLLVDDTIHSGKSMDHARELLMKAQVDQKITACAAFANPKPKSLTRIDIFFDTLPSPAVLEWNVMHRDKLEGFCVDIDGVLCRNPTRQEDDDGHEYQHFLETVPPLTIPTYKVGYLVTSRLEKYREETEAWLQKHNVAYNELIMLDLPDKATRVKMNASARFKASVYKGLPHSELFIESERKDAHIISRLSGKAVLCYSSHTFFAPTWSPALIELKTRKMAARLAKKGKRAVAKLVSADTWVRNSNKA